MKKKNYIPDRKFNPVIQANKIAALKADIDKQKEAIDSHKKNLEIVIASYDKHVEYLANFAQHDMKNAIQSMDSVLYTTDYQDISEDEWLSLKTCLNNIRETFNNFSKLVPYSPTKTFTIDKLLTALGVLTRNSILSSKINVTYDYPRSSNIDLILPFQSLLQMLHNVVLNAIKAVEETIVKEIKITAQLDDTHCKIFIYDSGIEIAKENENKIFEYRYTTTGGSGIGLYHAKYVCDKIGGKIIVNLEKNGTFTKFFLIEFPTKINSESK